MLNLLVRKELSHLLEWLGRPNRKPLVIRGARQVGKSTLVRQLASTTDLALLEINFERNPEYRDAFATKDPLQITSALGLLLGQQVTAGKNLLFLDEVQEAPEALAALRYFYEELPQLHLVAAGSLLEFALSNAQFSMPVGRVEYFHVGPMQFDDFLIAMGEASLADYLNDLSLNDVRNQNMVRAIHEKCLNLLRQYWVVGGLPEAVATYAATQDYFEVARVQQGIVTTYRDDFSKYSSGTTKILVQQTFDHLPLAVGRKFKYAHINRNYRAAQVATAFRQLCMAGIASPVLHTSANGAPLGAEASQNYFKALYMDIGLMCAALKLNVLDLAKSELPMVNNGSLAEQFVGQHLLRMTPTFQRPQLYYWVREAKGSAAEIDYLMTQGQEIVPIEIKAGTTGTLKSLHQFLKEKNRTFAVRFNADLPSLLDDSKTLSNGLTLTYQLLSLPLYMVGSTDRLASAAINI